MNNHMYMETWMQRFMLLSISVFLFYCPSHVKAQQAQRIALPTDGSFSAENSPQGGLRYQRQLYLITPEEMMASGISMGTDLNSIGFTIANAQNDTTRAGFQLYLQNTADTESRIDLDWSDSVSTSNFLILENLLPGDYEWQIQAVCPSISNSDFISLTEFSNADLSGCNQPTNLSASAVTSSGATLNWYAPDSPGFSHYKVEYKTFSETTWTAVTPDPTTLTADVTGLVPAENYQWQVRTFCGVDSSQLSGNTFTTLNIDNCDEPLNLIVTTLPDTTASLTWDAVTGANRYDIRFRRVGSSFWYPTLSFSNSLSLAFGLEPGSTYEWEVRTVCDAGEGAYVPGTNFETVGDVQCYVPTNLFINNLSDTTATLNWTPTVGASSYNIRYRLKNAISWTNAIAPMSAVSIDNDSITVPDNTGDFIIPFTAGTSFAYTGDGLYVAFQYSRSTGPLRTLNNSLATKANTVFVDPSGMESQIILCLDGQNDPTDIALPERLIATQLRPQTSFGSVSFIDSVAVEAVYAQGHYSTNYSGTNEVSALITNYADEERTYMVQFRVVNETELYSIQQAITIPATDSLLINFDGWSPITDGRDTLYISVPAATSENVLNNNEAYYFQTVGPARIGYDDGSSQLTNTGFGNEGGLVLVKQNITGCGKVNAAEVFLDRSSASANRSLYAVVLDKTGIILASSFELNPTDDETGSYHKFYFPNPPTITNDTFYVGLAQVANPDTAYYPAGIQWETEFIRDSAYYTANIDGTGLTHQPSPGRLMIRTEIVPGSLVPIIEGDSILCMGATNTLSVDSLRSIRYANEIIDITPGPNGLNTFDFGGGHTLGTPNVFPEEGIKPAAWTVAGTADLNGFIELGFPASTEINYIDIYETYNPGGVAAVYVKNPGTGMFEQVVLPASNETLDTLARVNQIRFPLTSFAVSEIRIELKVDSIYHAIDAVSIGEISPADAMITYLWSTGATDSSIPVDMAGNYSVTITDVGGCNSSTSLEVNNVNQVMPVITVSGDESTTFCDGQSIVLQASEFENIMWSTTETTQSILVSTSDSYTVEFDDGSGCGMNTSDPVDVTVNPSPAVTISGVLDICSGGSTTLDAGAGFASYSWSTGETTQTITVGEADEYSVFVVDGNGCDNTVTVMTNTANLPDLVISGNLDICPGGTTILDASAGFASYSWSTGATDQTITVSSVGDYTVFVEDVNGCERSGSVTTVLATPPSPVISGVLSICPGELTTLDAGNGYDSYNWFDGETSQTITINNAGLYSVTVTNSNGCSGSVTATVSENTPPTPSISGGSGFCPGETLSLDAGAGYSSYNWSNGAISQTISVGTNDTYTVTVSDSNGCTGLDSQDIEAFDPPMAPLISGELTFCDGNTTILSGSENLVSYAWSTGATTSAIVVNGPGTFALTVVDNNGCVGSDQVMTTFNGALPATPGPISGPSMGLCGATGLVYEILPVLNTTHYVWTVPNGMTITSGQGTTLITVDAIPNFNSGIIVAKASNSCGQSPTYNQQYLLVQGYPDIPGAPVGPTTGVCNFFTNIYAIDPVGGADSYNWTVPPGATILYGQGTTTIAVNFDGFSDSGDICVDAINSCGVSLCCFGNCLTVNCTTEAIDLTEPGGTGEEVVPEHKPKEGIDFFDELGIYPNPNSGHFRLEGNILEEGDFEIAVYSLLGDLVYYKNRGQRPVGQVKEAVTLPGLLDGTYIVKVKVGQRIWNKKVIIMR
jgi:hypothetical protein